MSNIFSTVLKCCGSNLSIFATRTSNFSFLPSAIKTDLCRFARIIPPTPLVPLPL